MSLVRLCLLSVLAVLLSHVFAACSPPMRESSREQNPCSYLKLKRLNIGRESLRSLSTRQRVRIALQCFENCVLTTESEPWAIMHGLLVAGPEFRILNIRTNKYVNALSFLLDENVRRDQGCERNLFIWRDPERFGPIVVDRWKTWEDHSDQVFFVLSEARVSLHTPIADGGGSVRATVGDLYRSVLKRRAWDLYADPTFAIGGIANFQASADSSSSASLSVLHSLILQSLSNKSSSYTCYGTHYRYALSVSLKTGVLDSDQRLKTAVQRRLEEDAVRLTNDLDAEGIVITEAEKRGIVAEYDRKTDLFEMVYLNGHCLEWLCHFLPGRGLVDQPITRAIDRLAEDLAAACQGQFQDYGALCHAAHALQMFEEKTRELLPEEQ